MDPIIEAAERKRDELRIRRDEIAQELKRIEDFLATYRTLALEVRLDSRNISGTPEASPAQELAVEGVVDEAERAPEAPDAARPKRVRVRDNPKPTEVVAAAVEVIRAAGRPLTRSQIHKALKERGMEVRGTDAVKTLGTMLWRSGNGLLEQIDGRGYWVAGDPVPSEDTVTQGSLLDAPTPVGGADRDPDLTSEFY